MNHPTIYCLNSKNPPDISDVGGKGYSLVKLTSLNLAVPPGIILCVSFFSSWIDNLKQSNLWKSLQFSKGKEEPILNDIKSYCLTNLSLDKDQTNQIASELTKQNLYDKSTLLAVRSSSPEEDLEGASFAGGYETYLGVNISNLYDYILKAFISCLDFRVFKYKQEKNFNPYDIKIAIVIMKQIASDVAGVGFSLNPINNDFDEAVITSNFGLGETVVGGIVSPDQYVVNKITQTIITKKIGKKEKVIHLSKNLNDRTEEQSTSNDMSSKSTLDDAMVIEIVKKISYIEECYNKPIDIEFAVEKGKLYLLQARPITTYFDLPKKMLTKPGDRRQLYLDVTLVIQGFDKSISILGITTLQKIMLEFGLKIFGSTNITDITNSALDIIGGKIFFNLSNIWAMIAKESTINFFKNISTVTANIISEVSNDYISPNKPYEMNVSKVMMIWRLPVFKLLFSNWFLHTNRDNARWGIDTYDNNLKASVDQYNKNELTFENLINTSIDDLTSKMRDYMSPVMYGGLINGYIEIRRLFEPYMKDNENVRLLVNNLVQCLPNITTIMGIDLFKLSQLCNRDKYYQKSFDLFKDDFEQKRLSQEFYTNFNKFIEKYGSRGEGELDMQNIRYWEDPLIIVNQIFNLIQSPSQEDPLAKFKEADDNRQGIFNQLNEIAQAHGFDSAFYDAYQRTLALLPFREDPKFLIIKTFGAIKKVLMPICDDYLKRKLIESKEQFWDLTIDDIIEMSKGTQKKISGEDIKKLIKKNRVDSDILKSWTRVPAIFDSRGRFFSQKQKELKEGELAGETVSWGIARGKAKVLKTVNEKVFNHGEILVTKATDPGWTPLIINSSAIVLEIGGMLQHGALVSREFNKPCVVGIDNVMNLIKDGDELEVDAVNGIVRILNPSSL